MRSIRKIFLIAILCTSIVGCLDFMGSDERLDYSKRIIIKRLVINSGNHIEWYHYSLVSGFSPGFIDKVTSGVKQNICKSHYVSDINFKNDTLIVQLWKGDSLGIIKNNDFVIKTDTTGVQPNF